jgi:hypothetical protein
MSILHKKSKRETDGYKLIGAYLPPRMHNYLTLYALAKETTKTKIIQKLIDDWVGQQILHEPDRDLVALVIQRANIQWKVEKTVNKNITFSQFKELLREELLKKGLREVHIKTILAEL